MFAVSVSETDKLVDKHEEDQDDYSKIMAQVSADRFVEALRNTFTKLCRHGATLPARS
jgi:cobalamin-dependent methionine synthase I